MNGGGLRNNNKSLQEWLGLENTEVSGPTTATPVVADVARDDRPGTRMNLAEALAAERSLPSELGRGPITRPNRSSESGPIEGSSPSMKVSLMRLLEETDGCDGERNIKGGEHVQDQGCDPVCCVCMGRKKDAAFIPCGHTFCRACARQVWANRGSCALCNRSIIEVLDIIY